MDKDKKAAELAHEIRSPLTGLSVMLDSLHDRLTGMPAEQELIVRSLAEIDRLENLLTEYLSDTDMYASGFYLGNISAIARETAFVTEQICDRLGLKLVTDINSTPDILINPPKLRQAMTNLINNATEAMQIGGTLTLSVKTSDQFITLTVEDTGCGINKTDIEHLFERSFTTKTSGTGIGLAVVKDVADSHGAEISVISEKNKGTSIILNFPF